MIEAMLRYVGVFLLHAAIGAAVVCVLAWLLHVLASRMGWQQAGARGPRWLPGGVRAAALCAIGAAILATGLQAGAVQALTRAVHETGRASTLALLVKAGGPIGIADADQEISLQDAGRLVDRLSPAVVARHRTKIVEHAWFRRAEAAWTRMPVLMRALAEQQVGNAKTTPRDLVHRAWRYGVAPAIESARQQALIFAYGSGIALVVFALFSEWLYLAWTRSEQVSRPV
jgi:hypothetical protein